MVASITRVKRRYSELKYIKKNKNHMDALKQLCTIILTTPCAAYLVHLRSSYLKLKKAVFWGVAPCRYCVKRRLFEHAHAGSSLADFLLFSSTVKMEAIHSAETSVKQYLHDATSQKTAFFIVTAVKTSDLTYLKFFF
jgi:hypothetical protein